MLTCFFVCFYRIGFEIPNIVCASALGMENGNIPDSAIVVSSRYNQYWGPERGRLNQKPEGKTLKNVKPIFNLGVGIRNLCLVLCCLTIASF